MKAHLIGIEELRSGTELLVFLLEQQFPMKIMELAASA